MRDYLHFSESIRGVTHARENKVNQDYTIAKTTKDYSMLIVADGHGAHQYIRSHIGATLACTVLEQLFTELIKEYDNYHSIYIEELKNNLKSQIKNEWDTLVFKHYSKNNLTDEEKKLIDPKKDPLTFYGTTLLGILIRNDYMIVVQIGDGDILALFEQNKLIKYIEKNKELLANQTTSLCEEDAIEHIEVMVVKLDELPVLVTISTDGVKNSFTDIEDFYRIPIEIAKEMNQLGFTTTCKNVTLLLTDMATIGSGDDCTLSLLYDSNDKEYR